MLFGPIRLVLRIIGLIVGVLLIYFVVTLVQVWLTSRQYDPHPAGAIVVMGAAQYNGVPSPDLEARLDEALSLFNNGYAKVIMVTGSKEPGDVYTESEAGRNYLVSKGVPATDILEAGGNDSYQNVADAAPQLLSRHLGAVLVVTDGFHEDRSMAIATALKLTPSPTPTQTSPITGWSKVPYFLKEALGVGMGRIIGYNHLEWLHDA
jgi:uncharacterized SAM-binding protein YcdF (DUF218 family)